MTKPVPSLPEEFYDRLKLIYGTNFPKVRAALSEARQKTIRVNTLATESDLEVTEKLTQSGILLQQEETIPHAYIVESGASLLSSTSEYKQGLFYIQGLSSQLVSIILDPTPDELILDIAAAPGSKTSHIAALMQNTGTIVANDISRERLFKLKNVLEQFHVKSCNPINFPGQMLWKHYENTFDRVLVDAPCSMEGRINASDPDTYDNWSHKRIETLAQRQKMLLRSAITCTKPGGTIVYSTCTLAPEENEEVIDWILKKDYNVSLESIEIPSLPFFQPLTEWDKKAYNLDVKKTLRVLPSAAWEGFFVAKLRKQ